MIETPGHTLGHVTYFFPDDAIAFTGDTLFSLGCGRVFEGDPQMMWNSVSKIAALPGDTNIYCGHEYTLNNARFAMTIEPENDALKARVAEVEALRAERKTDATDDDRKASGPPIRFSDRTRTPFAHGSGLRARSTGKFSRACGN